MANTTRDLAFSADLLHEIRTISRTLVAIHKDLQKLNSHLFLTSPIEMEKEKDTMDEQPT